MDGRVELVDRNDLTKRFPTSVVKALAHNDFYTIPGDGEVPDTTLEKFYDQTIESPGAASLGRIIDRRRSPTLPQLRRTVARLVAFQYLRGESSRFATVEQYKAMVQKVGKTLTPVMYKRYLSAMMGDEPSDAEVQELHDFAQDDSSYSIGVSSESLLHAQLAIHGSPVVAERLCSRVWEVVEFDEPLLITGDEPVALMNEFGDPGEALGVSLAPIVAFPTDPQHAILMHLPALGRFGGRWKGTPDFAHRINRHVAFSCHRFVVQRPGQDRVGSLDLPLKAGPSEAMGPYVIFRRNLSERGAAMLRHRMLGSLGAKR
jgi:hypothetical protein